MRKAIKPQGTIVGRLQREISRKMTTLSSAVQDDLIVGASAFPGNPYDVHTLNEQVEQATILMPALGTRPQTAFVVLGYRGVDKDNLGLDIKHRERINSLTDDKKKSLKRIQAIKPIIGHLKADHRMPPVSPQGFNEKQFACSPVRCRLQHPLVAADDR